ncbi:hypothetical protein CDAR_613081 [Caerostris darwini]|uniref:Uncharacterized protein n=1 Tax=Caerostris darwini TaxID=1538125 RepID=A0AAV4SV05_9ARAC|nr:hypothetical protein CDAR_34831 [Caerostris darwini]GIY36305.1 hypothetical protein CDAR_613081 [Caerostris darwini]
MTWIILKQTRLHSKEYRPPLVAGSDNRFFSLPQSNKELLCERLKENSPPSEQRFHLLQYEESENEVKRNCFALELFSESDRRRREKVAKRDGQGDVSQTN